MVENGWKWYGRSKFSFTASTSLHPQNLSIRTSALHSCFFRPSFCAVVPLTRGSAFILCSASALHSLEWSLVSSFVGGPWKRFVSSYVYSCIWLLFCSFCHTLSALLWLLLWLKVDSVKEVLLSNCVRLKVHHGNRTRRSWNRLDEAKLSQHTLRQMTLYDGPNPQEARKHAMCYQLSCSSVCYIWVPNHPIICQAIQLDSNISYSGNGASSDIT